MHLRRLASVAPTTHVHENCGPYADARAVVKTNRPPLGIRGVWAADDPLPTIELRGAAESCK